MLLLPLHNGYKPRAERFLRVRLNLLDIDCYLRSWYLKWCHCWLSLSLSNEQKPQKSEGKIISFFLPNSTLTPQQLQLKFALSCTQLLLHSRGSRRSFPGLVRDVGTWCRAWRGEESHRLPSGDRRLGSCLRAWLTLPRRAEWVRNRFGCYSCEGISSSHYWELSQKRP